MVISSDYSLNLNIVEADNVQGNSSRIKDKKNTFSTPVVLIFFRNAPAFAV